MARLLFGGDNEGRRSSSSLRDPWSQSGGAVGVAQPGLDVRERASCKNAVHVVCMVGVLEPVEGCVWRDSAPNFSHSLESRCKFWVPPVTSFTLTELTKHTLFFAFLLSAPFLSSKLEPTDLTEPK
jgi:hypothetical protein